MTTMLKTTITNAVPVHSHHSRLHLNLKLTQYQGENKLTGLSGNGISKCSGISSTSTLSTSSCSAKSTEALKILVKILTVTTEALVVAFSASSRAFSLD